MGLFNKETFSAEESKTAFEQYKLYVEMANKISERRGNVNTFFTTLNTLLFTVTAVIKSRDLLWVIFTCAIGCIISFAWYFTLNSYRQLNSGKFKVINEIEQRLPLSGFSYEWEVLASGMKKNKYWPISHVEKIVPAIFFAAYLIMAVILCVF